MLTNRSIMLFCLILLIAVSTNLIIEQDNKSDANPTFARNDPDIYMLNAEITQFTATGTRQHKLGAVRMTHFPLTDVTTLKIPNLRLYSDQDDAQPWHISANHGRLLPEKLVREEIVELWEQVVATQQADEGEFMNIQTDSLTVYPAKDYAETDQRVIINNRSGQTIAGAMQAHFEQGHFIFYASQQQRVHTTLQPKF